jgi:hypothetical protein
MVADCNFLIHGELYMLKNRYQIGSRVLEIVELELQTRSRKVVRFPLFLVSWQSRSF